MAKGGADVFLDGASRNAQLQRHFSVRKTFEFVQTEDPLRLLGEVFKGLRDFRQLLARSNHVVRRRRIDHRFIRHFGVVGIGPIVVPHRRPSLVSQPVEHHVPTDPIEVGGRIADMTVVQFRNPDEDILHKIFRRLGRF